MNVRTLAAKASAAQKSKDNAIELIDELQESFKVEELKSLNSRTSTLVACVTTNQINVYDEKTGERIGADREATITIETYYDCTIKLSVDEADALRQILNKMFKAEPAKKKAAKKPAKKKN